MKMHGLRPIRNTWRPVFLYSPLFFILLGLPMAGLGIILWIRRKQDLLDALDPVEKKRRRARKIAETHLQGALANIEGSERLFYDSLSRAIFGYISAKLNIPASELTKSNINSQLGALNLPDDLRNETIEILNTSEQILYAGGTSQTNRQQMYDRTLELIGAVEECVEKG
jgi:hypothetical protein